MPRKLLIDATHPEETRAAVVEDGKVREFDYESKNKKQITGNIYLAKVVRAEPSLQAVFVEYGGNRHGFLAFSEIHPHYYKIPVADQQPGEETETGSGEAGSQGNQEIVTDADETGADALVPVPQVERSRKDASGLEVIDIGDPEGPDIPIPADSAPAGDQADFVSLPDEPLRDQLNSSDDGPDDSEADHHDFDERAEVNEDIRRQAILQRTYKVQEVIRQKQLLLVQVVKDERGSKGAALTTYISLAGRYCVLMPNTDRGGGISRKITNVAHRRKLKKIASEIEVPEGVGLIIRTAGANRTKQEIKRDYEYLIRQWDQIRELTFKSIAPAKIFEDGGLIRRSIRDDYTKGIDEVLVEGEGGYKTAKSFMKMIMPSHAKKVKKYSGNVPLFATHGIERFLSDLFEPVVQLPSGGYVVIGITEALVAIDVNSGKATRHGTLEQTALQTNLEAAETIADQLRLRDLAGLIVIDFIDMEDSKHNSAVEKCLKERLKGDRSKIQTGRITSFGLLEMSRQRLRPGLQELSSQPCPACNGAGLVRTEESIALEVLRQIEMKATGGTRGSIVATVPVGIANIILNRKRGTLAHIETAHSVSVLVEGHPGFAGRNIEIRRVAEQLPATGDSQDTVISVETSLQKEGSKSNTEQASEAPRRRRRRTSRSQARRAAKSQGSTSERTDEAELSQEDARKEVDTKAKSDSDDDGQKEKRSRRGRRRSGSKSSRKETAQGGNEVQTGKELQHGGTAVAQEKEPEEVKSAKKRRKRPSRRKPGAPEATGAPPGASESGRPVNADQPQQENQSGDAEVATEKGKRKRGKKTAIQDQLAAKESQSSDTVASTPDETSGKVKDASLKARTGWWSPDFQSRKHG